MHRPCTIDAHGVTDVVRPAAIARLCGRRRTVGCTRSVGERVRVDPEQPLELLLEPLAHALLVMKEDLHGSGSGKTPTQRHIMSATQFSRARVSAQGDAAASSGGRLRRQCSTPEGTVRLSGVTLTSYWLGFIWKLIIAMG